MAGVMKGQWAFQVNGEFNGGNGAHSYSQVIKWLWLLQ